MHKKIIALILAIVILLSGFGVYHFFYDTQAIEPKQYLSETVSPNYEYTIRAYIDNGNATEGSSVLCVLYDHDSNKELRNIYWNHDCDSAEIEWLSDTSVIINGTKIDDITKDKFDFRFNNDELTFQNQYLNKFGVDFISSKCKVFENDELKKYLSIKLNKAEKQKMDEYASNSLFSIADYQTKFDYLCSVQESNFSKVTNFNNGYFSFYNKVNDKIIDIQSSDIKLIDMDFYTLIVYDTDNNEIHLFDYNRS